MKVELLAPAGSFEALKAAVENGADAVYLGGKNFGARQYANNFDESGLIEAVRYCHIRGVKVYVTVNTLVKNNELQEVMRYINFLYNIGVDAIIIQDIGILKYLREEYPDFEIHASTQMTAHNIDTFHLLKETGVKRIVASREMTIEEIINIKGKVDIEVEVFVHGALCICYSGQCLMSSMLGGRSGNRGRCAQPCRLPYALVGINQGREILYSQECNLLSPRDLNTIMHLDKLIEAGVDSFKIEGRMKRTEYVAVVVKNYRNAIDSYLETGKLNVSPQDLRELELIFNRKFTKGYLFGARDEDIISFEKSGNRGKELGKILGFNNEKSRVRIKLTDETLIKGDGIRIKTKDKEFGVIVQDIYKDGKKISKGNPGDVVEVFLKEKVKEGVVFKTSDVTLLENAYESYKTERKIIPIDGLVVGRIGSPLELYLWDRDGNSVSAVGDFIIEKAEKVPVGVERIDMQIRKLGGTPYRINSLKIEIDENISLPIREINDLRRRAIEKLDEARSNVKGREKKPFKDYAILGKKFNYTNTRNKVL